VAQLCHLTNSTVRKRY